MKRKAIVSLLLVALISINLFANGQIETQKNRIFEDVLGREVSIPQEVNKIVSLEPSATSIIVQLNKENLLVGIDDKSLNAGDIPVYLEACPELRNLPNVGDRKNPNLEVLLQLDPDLIITRTSFEGAEELSNNLGIPVFVVNSLRDNDWEYFEKLGKITNSESRSNELITFYKDLITEISNITLEVSNQKKPTVYLSVFTESGEITTSMTTYQSITPAGGVNLVGKMTADTSWGAIEISKEQIIAWNPDYIFIDWIYAPTCVKIEDVLNNPLYKDLNAVVNNNVFYTNMSHSGKEYPLAFSEMFYFLKILHPNLTDSLNIIQKGDEIFHFVYGLDGFYSKWLAKRKIEAP